jgi:hypothetical protein
MDTNDIAREILMEIRRANPAAAATEEKISDIIKKLRRPRPPYVGYRRQNRKYAEDVIKWIEKGEKLLLEHHDTIHPELLFCQGFNEGSFVADEDRKRLQQLKDILDSMRRQCSLIVNSKFGKHGNAGQDQERAAWAAAGLIMDAGLPLTYTSESSAYCTVALLLFKAMTGKESGNGSHIMKACRAIAQMILAWISDEANSTPVPKPH